MGQAAEHPETSIHQAQRQGISSEHVNGTKRERGTTILMADVSAKAAGHSKETKAIGGRYNYFFIASAILSGSDSSLSFTLLRTSSLLFIP